MDKPHCDAVWLLWEGPGETGTDVRAVGKFRFVSRIEQKEEWRYG